MAAKQVKAKVIKDSVITDAYSIYNGDSCQILPTIPDESVGLCIHSPPFASLFSYSSSEKDLSNCSTYEEFFVHYGFIAEQLKRVMMPGRVVAIHCMDLPTHKSSEGYIGQRDFPGDIIRLFESKGMIYHSRVCIWKDPLIAATRTHAIGLAHKQIVKDSSLCRNGIADYLIAFRKKGDNPKPIKNENGLTTYYGEKKVPGDLEHFFGSGVHHSVNKRSHYIWQQYASPVWMDIRQTNVLPFKQGKEEDDARHLCPLQLDVIERCIALWSTRDDIVLTPFMGVGSEVYVAVKNKRKGLGIELKSSYFRQAVRNLESLKHEHSADSGFFE